MCLEWFGEKKSSFSPSAHQERLFATQMADGSWQQLPDANFSSGELNATVVNYWFLKSQEVDPSCESMEKAKAFILGRGGIEASSLFTKVFLALFCQYRWDRFPRIPYLLFAEYSPLNYWLFSQWVIPHLIAIAYLRKNKVCRDLGSRFDVPELFLDCESVPRTHRPPNWVDRWLLRKILSWQQPHGSWGGYTVSTIMCLMALEHDKCREKYPTVYDRGLYFIESLYSVAPQVAPGCLMDGHYWDTLLVAQALWAAGVDEQKLFQTVEFLTDTQSSSGGFPYGIDFEYAPDVDDTAVAVKLLSAFPSRRARAQKALKWLISQQNGDGGWGAFAKDNSGSILRLITRSFQDSVELFDASSADSTGHVLEALGNAGELYPHSASVLRAVQFLRKTQTECGGWKGRWGVNFLFGTTCALSGLAHVRMPRDPFIEHALRFLLGCQKPDGSFGESTASYIDAGKAGQGSGTPTQTAWALSALLQWESVNSPSITRAVSYLLDSFDATTQSWADDAPTGTGHPGLLYMNYPSYAASFPLLSLSGYRAAILNLPCSVENLPTHGWSSNREVFDRANSPG